MVVGILPCKRQTLFRVWSSSNSVSGGSLCHLHVEELPLPAFDQSEKFMNLCLAEIGPNYMLMQCVFQRGISGNSSQSPVCLKLV